MPFSLKCGVSERFSTAICEALGQPQSRLVTHDSSTLSSRHQIVFNLAPIGVTCSARRVGFALLEMRLRGTCRIRSSPSRMESLRHVVVGTRVAGQSSSFFFIFVHAAVV